MEVVNKIQDTFNDRKSIADRSNYITSTNSYYKLFRRKSELPSNLTFNVETPVVIANRYKLRGFQFGNWAETEDRFNYLASFYLCMFDLQKVLRFKKNNLGMNGVLGIALGARGGGAGVAHFEPYNNVINLTRYIREDVLKKRIRDSGRVPKPNYPKIARFQYTGGIGAFAHEYGHFLDHIMCQKFEPWESEVYLSGPRGSVSRKRFIYPKKYVLHNIMEDFFKEAFWTNGKPSNFDLRLKAQKSEYINSRVEVFARVFEQYIHYKLNKVLGITNAFMTDTKYQTVVYMKQAELEKVIPILDKLILEFRKRS